MKLTVTTLAVFVCIVILVACNVFLLASSKKGMWVLVSLSVLVTYACSFQYPERDILLLVVLFLALIAQQLLASHVKKEDQMQDRQAP